MPEQKNRLYRSRTNKIIAGICGGLSEYFNVDVTIIRLLWILITFLGGSGILVYIIAYFLIPERPVESGIATEQVRSDFAPARIFGVIFVAVGIIILLDNLGILSFHRWWHLTSDFIFPSLLIVIGIYFLTKKGRGTIIDAPSNKQEPVEHNQEQSQTSNTSEKKGGQKRLHRSVKDKKILGICGGAGEYFDIDPTIVRIAYVLFTFLSGGMGLILYFILYLVIPEADMEQKK